MTKVGFKIFSLFLTTILLSWGCGSSSDNNFSNQPLIPPSNIDEAKLIAKNRASVHPDIDFSVEHVSDSQLSYPLFEGSYFLYLWGAMGHTQSTSFVVAPNGSAFKLPQEFNAFIKNEDVLLNSSEKAIDLLNFYLNFQTVWPGTDYFLVVEDMADVPGYEGTIDQPKLHTTSISQISHDNGSSGWEINFFTWKAINGILSEWQVTILNNGILTVKSRIKLDDRVGSYLTIE